MPRGIPSADTVAPLGQTGSPTTSTDPLPLGPLPGSVYPDSHLESANKSAKPTFGPPGFPAFAGTMAQLLCALEEGTEPEIGGRDNLETIALCEAVRAAASQHRVTTVREFLRPPASPAPSTARRR